MMQRLPFLPKHSNAGYVYVLQRDSVYKIGFSRRNPERRAYVCKGKLILTIATGQYQPSQLEYLLNNRFAAKRLPSQGDKPGDKREWFALSESDIDWLKGLAVHLSTNT